MSCDLFNFFCDSSVTEYEVAAHQCIQDNGCTVYTGVVNQQDIFNFHLTSQDGKITKEIKTDIDIFGQKVYFYIENHKPLEVSSHDCEIINNNSLHIHKYSSPGESITIIIKKPASKV
ncbi:hypothetical protein BIY23_02425 [Wolbachia pipientis]|uniref:Uncharacterized protein n=1 Tax=Wolbachia pipientis TaxID=955 RepID=A0A1E7QJP1_WOLPI|nr:hypothetical protein [Wolbachia pipientis]OEY86692.1 hypothetical protein BIY23_02425 [Wolbachia pipientis]